MNKHVDRDKANKKVTQNFASKLKAQVEKNSKRKDEINKYGKK